jgi:hypothetical protein
MNKFPFECRTRLDRTNARTGKSSREQLYRIGRILLLGAAFAIGTQMVFNAVNGGGLTMTLHAMLDLSPPERAQSALAPILAPVGLVVDSPVWLVLLVAGAISFAIAAAHQFLKATPR